MAPYLLLLILWVVYFSLHSLFARPALKDWVGRRLPWLSPHYRLLYSIGSVLGLLGILVYNVMISGARLLAPNDFMRYAGLMLATGGVIVIRQAFRVYSMAEFLGLKPAQPQHTADSMGLRTDGILGRVRHPIYLGTLLLVLGFWLYIPTLANLLTTGAIIVYLFVGIRLEERDLEQQFGEAYREYRKRVPMLIPSWRRKSDTA